MQKFLKKKRIVKKFSIDFKEEKEVANLHMEAIEFENCFHVELWDVTQDYHSLKPFEHQIKDELPEFQKELKELKQNKDKTESEKAKMEHVQKSISFLTRYKNKRYKLTKEEFHNTYKICGCVYLDTNFKGYEKDYFGNPMPVGCLSIKCLL